MRLDVAPKTVLSDVEIKGLGLVPVQRRQDSVIAAYATDHDLNRFEERTATYATGALKLAALAKIEHVRPWSREDRMSERLKAVTIEPGTEYIVDVLLLPLEDEEPNPQALRVIEAYVAGARGEVLDSAQERSFTAVRIRLGGQSLDALLDYRDDIAEVDLPPRARITVPEIAGFSLDSIPEVAPPAGTVPAICVVDSGILEGHPLLEPAVLSDRSRSFPASLGPPIPNVAAEQNGHGTQVAGIAVYADVAASVAKKSFEPHAWILNARVLDDNADFHPNRMPSFVTLSSTPKIAAASSTCPTEWNLLAGTCRHRPSSWTS